MALSEMAAIAVFIAVVLFGIVDTIRTPIIIRRFYKNKSFTDSDKQIFAEFTKARIVDGMYTEHLFGNAAPLAQVANEVSVKSEVMSQSGAANSITGLYQSKAWSVDRRKFTLSKATRKRNRTPWSVTIVKGDFKDLSCIILPTVVPDAILYVGNGENMDFEDDPDIANRYHITTNNEELIRSVLTGEVREFLLRAHIVFIEVTEGQLVMRRNWADHLVLERLDEELRFVKQLGQKFV